MASSSSPTPQPAEPSLPIESDPGFPSGLDEALAELDRGEGVDAEAFVRDLILETRQRHPSAA